MHLLLRGLTAAILGLTLIACGTPGPGGEAPRSGGTDSTCNGAEIDVVLRAQSEMLRTASTWQDRLFNTLTPQKAHAFEGLESNSSLSDNAISVVRINQGLSESSFTELSYDVEQDGSGAYVITFCGAADSFSPQINIVVKASLPNGESLYAPLHFTSGGEPIFIDVSSDFIVRRLFAQTTSAQVYADLIDSDQLQVKTDLLRFLYISADGFDIKFDENDSLSEAQARLENDTAYLRFVDAGLDQILNNPPSPIAKGTQQTTIPLDGPSLSCLTWRREYNSLLFQLGLNQKPLNSTSNATIWSSRLSERVPTNEFANASEIYPELGRTTFMYDRRREVMSIALPYKREALTVSESANQLASDSLFNFFSLAQRSSEAGLIATDTYLTTEGNLLYDRTIPPYVPQSNSTTSSIGWHHNPVFSLLYDAQDLDRTASVDTEGEIFCSNTESFEPAWLSGAYFSNGTSYEQISGNNNFDTDEVIESLNLFSWEIHSEKSNQADPEDTEFQQSLRGSSSEAREEFSRSRYSGKNFGAISYAVDFDTDTPEVNIKADLYRWQSASNNIEQTQPNTHYVSYSLTRDPSDVAVLTGPSQSAGTENRPIGLQIDAGGQQLKNGLILLDGGEFGQATPDGSYLSFLQDNTEKGRGVIVAMEERSADAILSNDNTPANYALSGNIISLETIAGTGSQPDTHLNHILGLESSELIITETNSPSAIKACEATLRLRYLSATQNLANNNVSLTPTEDYVEHNASTCLLNKNDSGQIEIGFDGSIAEGSTLSLIGFMSKSDQDNSALGKVLNLVWVQDNALGYVLGHLKQALAPDFSD